MEILTFPCPISIQVVLISCIYRVVSAGWYDDHVYDATVPLLSQEENPAYEAVSGGGPGGKGQHAPPTLPKPLAKSAKPKVS